MKISLSYSFITIHAKYFEFSATGNYKIHCKYTKVPPPVTQAAQCIWTRGPSRNSTSRRAFPFWTNENDSSTASQGQ
jgi:hypothetical protein